MEMEDSNNHHNNQYGIDLRQFISGRPAASSSHFPPLIPHPPLPPPPELFPGHRNFHAPPPGHQHHYDLMMLMPRSGLNLHDFTVDSTAPVVTSATITNTNTTTTTTDHSVSGSTTVAASSSGLANALMSSGLEGEGGCFNAIGVGGGDIGGNGRWPRQETLTLLEIRSRLDSKFKEANQKGPLWDEVSRIMSEEHGYQRSGKKCREKFENLYKYYKKTKEGKAGRQDGKHYRFFRQLEALYGETSNPNIAQETHSAGNVLGFHTAVNTATQANNNQLEVFQSQKLCDSLSLSNSSEFDTTSEENDLSTATLGENDSVEKRRKKRSGKSWKTKIKEFLDAQMRNLMERQEAWLERLTRTLEEKEKERLIKEEEWRRKEAERVDREHRFWAKEREWLEARDAALMEALQKLTGREVNASSPEGVAGAHEFHNQSDHNQNEDGSEGIKTSVLKIKEGNKKRKENSRSSSYFQSNESMYHPGEGRGYCEINGQSDGPSPANSNAGNAVNDSCFCFLMSGTEGENLWENYGLRLSKGDHQNQ